MEGRGKIGSKGDKDGKGDQGNKGDSGPQGSKRDKGDYWLKGDKGDKRDKGDIGDTGLISVSLKILQPFTKGNSKSIAKGKWYEGQVELRQQIIDADDNTGCIEKTVEQICSPAL